LRRLGDTTKGAAAVLLLLWIAVLSLAGNLETRGKGLLLFSSSLFAFTITYEVIDWIEGRKQKKQHPALPDNVSLKDVIAWNDEVENARKDA